MKSAFFIFVLLAILGVTLWWAIHAWNAVDVEMSVHGYVAMTLGIIFSLVIGCGLMALMFYSSRHGYDDAVMNYEGVVAAKDRWASGSALEQASCSGRAGHRTVVPRRNR